MTFLVFATFSRWDNGETEKLSPWDVEPIGDDGEPLYNPTATVLYVKTSAAPVSRVLKRIEKCVCVVQPRSQRPKEAGSP